jgi:glyoxylase-like metal-dependent hydrolase (beta-lactamase superfamily II)
MTESEWLMGRMLALDTTEASTRWMVEFYRRAGCEGTVLSAFAEGGNSYAPMVEITSSFRRLRDGDRIRIDDREWQVIVGRGHAPEQACLWTPDLDIIIVGDQLLPRITPNISVWPEEPEANPLALFLDSLKGFSGLSDEVLVLPSHKLPYRGLHRRLGQLADHHNERLERARTACRNPTTAMGVVESMFRPGLDRHQLMFAIGEALAHLHLLMSLGEIRRTARRDGVIVYRRT